jgi:hypothetical protein
MILYVIVLTAYIFLGFQTFLHHAPLLNLEPRDTVAQGFSAPVRRLGKAVTKIK